MRKPALRFGICLAVIAAALFARGAGLPFGGSENSAEAAVSFKLPWKAGVTYTVTQGWHQGYAYDFGLPEGTEVRASAAGKIVALKKDIAAGVCGGSSYANLANYVKVAHSDGTFTLYLHLKTVSVAVGQAISQGQAIGTSGKTGWTSCGPHLHFARLSSSGASVKVFFDEYPGKVLDYPMRVTSQNAGPPTVVLDDRSAGFSLYGPSQYWLQYRIGYGSHMFATWNNGPCSLGSGVCPQGQDVNYAVWRPSIPSTRNYRVCAFIPADHAYTTSARYKIAHAAGDDHGHGQPATVDRLGQPGGVPFQRRYHRLRQVGRLDGRNLRDPPDRLRRRGVGRRRR